MAQTPQTRDRTGDGREDFPARLPSAEQWMEDTRRSFPITRSPELSAVDEALRRYRSDEQTFQAVDRAFTQWIGGNVENRASRNPGPVFPISSLHEALERNRKYLDEKRQSRSYLRPPEQEIPKVMPMVWVGSVPTEQIMQAARNWRDSHPGVKVDIWVDKNNLLANDFKAHTAKLREASSAGRQGPAGPSDDDPAVAQRHRLWEGRDHARDTLDALWTEGAGRREQYQNNLAGLMNDHAGDGARISIRDVGSLFDPAGKVGSLTAEERKELHVIYQRELGERCNPANAADVVRLLAVYDKAGLYTDTDVIPPVAHLPKLEQDLRDVGFPVPADRWPVVLLNSKEYVAMMGAVEEHLGHLAKNREAQPGGPGYSAFLAHADKLDPTGQARRGAEIAFGTWADSIRKRIEDPRHGSPFVPLETIRARPDLFRIFQPNAKGEPSSNQVIGTSQPGSEGVAIWLRTIITNTREVMANDRKKKSYFDDRPENSGAYEQLSLSTVGAAVVNQVMLPQRKLAPLGIWDKNDYPGLGIPNTVFPNPSLAEKHSTWVPGRSAAAASPSPLRAASTHSGSSTRHGRR
jgi:hypothetical protein